MRLNILIVLACGLMSAVLSAQQSSAAGVDGSFHFTSPVGPQDLKEAETIVRTVADLPQTSTDASQATIAFHGNQDNVALAVWILGELDRPGGETAPHEYTLPTGEVARVNFLLPNVATPRERQELLTVLRTVADMRKVFSYTSRPAIVMRGKEPDVAFAEWIVDQLNQPAQQTPDKAAREYTLSGSLWGFTAARVNFLTNVNNVKGLQEILTVIRTVAQIQKTFNFTNQRAIVLRGTDTDVARAEWLIQGLDQPAGQQNPGTHVFTAPDADDVTRIFYISNASPRGLQAALKAIRAEAKITRAFSTSAPSTVVVRGTADQVEAAAQVIAAGNGLL